MTKAVLKLIKNLYKLLNSLMYEFLLLNNAKKFIFSVIVFLLFNIKQLRFFMLSINLIFISFEIVILIIWLYDIYFCYLNNIYLCLNFKNIYYKSIGISFWNNLIIYNKASVFIRLKFFILSKNKNKKFSIINFIFLLTMWILNIPAKSIRLIYEIVFLFDVTIFINYVKYNKLKLYFNELTEQICLRFCEKNLFYNKSKIELFNRNFYF